MADHPDDRSDRTPVVVLDGVDSTNAEALRRAVGGQDRALWVIADRQAAGRGRSGRAWASPAGNLFATRLLWLGCPPRVVPQLSLVTGVGVIDAIREALGHVGLPDLRLKWPNDILIDGAKVGGILIESTTVGQRMAVAIGVGLNLMAQPANLGRAVTTLAAHGVQADRRSLVGGLDRALDAWLRIWNEGIGIAAVRSAWLDRAGAIGEPMRLHSGDAIVEGTFGGIDDDGALLMIDSAGSRSRHTFGDVSLPGDDGR